MSDTYANVDASADPDGAVAWQERMSAWPAVHAYKHRTLELLAGVRSVVDVGCGPGVDAVALGPARCVGVERSTVMARASARRGVAICCADAHALPFASAAFGGSRADRVLQHLAHPMDALRELVRVVEPGGTVVVADPDQATLAIDVPGVRRTVLDRLVELRRDVGVRNGTLIARVPAWLRDLGLDDVHVEAFPLTLTDPADAFGLPSWPELWRAVGPFSDPEVDEWNGAIRSSPNGFRYAVTFVVVAARKP